MEYDYTTLKPKYLEISEGDCYKLIRINNASVIVKADINDCVNIYVDGTEVHYYHFDEFPLAKRFFEALSTELRRFLLLYNSVYIDDAVYFSVSKFHENFMNEHANKLSEE